MRALLHYARVWLAFARFGLMRELSFRGNFLIKVSVELLWLAILLVFYDMVFTHTRVVADWSRDEYLFFVGCYYALGGVIETFFLINCSEFAELVRTGDLDFYLLLPANEQFLITSRDLDWATLPNIFLGAAVSTVALVQLGWPVEVGRLVLFLILFGCGVALAYSFLVLLTAASVWLVRNQSLYEVWWLFTTFMRYPREIFAGRWVYPVGWFFNFVVPIILVTNVPARLMVKALEPELAVYTVLASVVFLAISCKIFRLSLQHYRSASS